MDVKAEKGANAIKSKTLPYSAKHLRDKTFVVFAVVS